MKRKEIVIQRDITDCGPCCLLSIIKHYNGNVPLEKIRLDSYADNRGTSAYNLIEASKNYGFDSAGLKVNNISDIKPLPCIAHVILDNGLNHYIVIYEIKKDKIVVMDPSKGKCILSIKEFVTIWDNIIITFHPKHKIIKYPVQNNILSFFLSLVLKEKSKYLKIIILSLLITILNIVLNFYFKIGDYAIKNQISFILVFLLYIIFIFLKNTFILIHNNDYIKLNSKVHKSLILDFTSHIFSLPSTILQNKTSGEIMTRVNELNDVQELLSQIVVGCILDGLLVINSGIVLFCLNKNIALIVLIVMLCYYFVSNFSAKSVNYKLHKWIDKDTSYNETLLDAIDMYPSINNLQIKRQTNDNLSYHLSEKIIEDINLNKYLNIINFIKGIIGDIVILIINTMALLLIAKNQMTLTNYIIINSIYIYLFNSFTNILNILPKYYYLKNTIYKISEFKNIDSEIDNGIKPFSNGDLFINNLSYKFNDNTILNDLSFKIMMGKSYFIIGPSGSGKSTFLKILYKQIEDYQGSITINDTNYKDIKLNSLRDSITFINQSEKLFSGTIYQNIICFRNISTNEFDNVCKICLIDKIVDKKPLRYLSNVKDSLVNLSGGEKQQIILARNLLKNGSIIIIDEALSEVDIDTETTIIKNILKYYKNKTILYVSHKDLSNLFGNKITIPQN